MERVEVLIIGAGISGLGVAHRLRKSAPHKTYLILERTSSLGGTWNHFKYPGFRTDSDMHTFGFSFKPWRDPAMTQGVPGDVVMSYLREAADEFGLANQIRYNVRAVRACWSSSASEWSVECDNGVRYVCRVLCGCAGYYEYDRGYTPSLPGLDAFGGQVVHPHRWDPSIELAGKRVVVIGSGATAVTLAPKLVVAGATVTMLQRSPSYIMPVPASNVASVPHLDGVAYLVRLLVGTGAIAHALLRWWKILFDTLLTTLCDARPAFMKRLALWMITQYGGRRAGDRLRMEQLTPRYNLWEERACLSPDADFFTALGTGRLTVVTDQVERICRDGVLLRGSGTTLPADLIVTATGFNMLPPGLGDLQLLVDGAPYTLGGRLAYKGALAAGLPNFVTVAGYTRMSWTLRVELVARFLVRLIDRMDANGFRRFVARPDAATERAAQRGVPAVSLKSGYVRRAAARLPVQGPPGPWRSTDVYFVDVWRLLVQRLDDGSLTWSRGGAAEPEG